MGNIHYNCFISFMEIGVSESIKVGTIKRWAVGGQNERKISKAQ